MHCPPCFIFFSLALLKIKRHPSLLLPGCLQVSDDSLSSRVYQSAPVQLTLLPTFCPLAFAVISDDHSRFGSWKSTQIANTLRHKHVYCPRAFCSMIQDFSFLLFFLCVMFLFVSLLAETVKQTRHDFSLPICTLFALVWWEIEEYLILSIPRDNWGNAFLLQHSLSLLFSFSFSVCISHLPSHCNCIFPY